jgi:hypothetical protein
MEMKKYERKEGEEMSQDERRGVMDECMQDR